MDSLSLDLRSKYSDQHPLYWLSALLVYATLFSLQTRPWINQAYSSFENLSGYVLIKICSLSVICGSELVLSIIGTI